MDKSTLLFGAGALGLLALLQAQKSEGSSPKRGPFIVRERGTPLLPASAGVGLPYSQAMAHFRALAASKPQELLAMPPSNLPAGTARILGGFDRAIAECYVAEFGTSNMAIPREDAFSKDGGIVQRFAHPTRGEVWIVKKNGDYKACALSGKALDFWKAHVQHIGFPRGSSSLLSWENALQIQGFERGLAATYSGGSQLWRDDRAMIDFTGPAPQKLYLPRPSSAMRRYAIDETAIQQAALEGRGLNGFGALEGPVLASTQAPLGPRGVARSYGDMGAVLESGSTTDDDDDIMTAAKSYSALVRQNKDTGGSLLPASDEANCTLAGEAGGLAIPTALLTAAGLTLWLPPLSAGLAIASWSSAVDFPVTGQLSKRLGCEIGKAVIPPVKSAIEKVWDDAHDTVEDATGVDVEPWEIGVALIVGGAALPFLAAYTVADWIFDW